MSQLPDHHHDVGPGWIPILEKLHSGLVVYNQEYRVMQVKEKFGRLRVYLENETPDMLRLIAEFEDKSGRKCEQCGKVGYMHVSPSGWWKTFCGECGIGWERKDVH